MKYSFFDLKGLFYKGSSSLKLSHMFFQFYVLLDSFLFFLFELLDGFCLFGFDVCSVSDVSDCVCAAV